ncbi:hypothetical protein SRHO_G00113750 [Serrasalmus rhombeus]
MSELQSKHAPLFPEIGLIPVRWCNQLMRKDWEIKPTCMLDLRLPNAHSRMKLSQNKSLVSERGDSGGDPPRGNCGLLIAQAPLGFVRGERPVSYTHTTPQNECHVL